LKITPYSSGGGVGGAGGGGKVGVVVGIGVVWDGKREEEGEGRR